VQKLSSEIVLVKESAYESVTLAAFDDGLTSREMISMLPVEELALFMTNQLRSRWAGAFVLAFKISGAQLMANVSLAGLNSLLGKTFAEL
jgi:hypothetical protein